MRYDEGRNTVGSFAPAHKEVSLVKLTIGDMVKIGLVAAVFIWLLKLVFKLVNIPGISPAVENL